MRVRTLRPQCISECWLKRKANTLFFLVLIPVALWSNQKTGFVLQRLNYNYCFWSTHQDCISELLPRIEALQLSVATAEDRIETLNSQNETNKNQAKVLDNGLQLAEVEKRKLLEEFSRTKDELLANVNSQQKEMIAMKQANLDLQKELDKQAKNYQVNVLSKIFMFIY